MRYRRVLIDGATYFFTVNLVNRRSHLLVEQIDLLRKSVREVRQARPFEILACVVLPEHMHAVWRLPPDGSDSSMRWNQIKAGFCRRIPKGEPVSQSRAKKRERGIWQRRFWEHLVRYEDDLARHVDYLHYNPVKHGYSSQTSGWPFSFFHYFVRRRWLQADWGCSGDFKGEFGERK